MIIVLFFLGWSLTTLLVNGSIFDPIRNYLLVKHPFFGKLLSCIQCTSVWVGAIIFWPLLITGDAPFILPYHWVSYIAYPVLQSGISVIAESFVIFLVKRGVNN